MKFTTSFLTLILTSVTTARTYDAFVPRNVEVFLGQNFIGNPAPYIPLRTIPVPKSDVARKAYKFAKKNIPSPTFLHSERAYFYTAAILLHPFFPSTPGVAQLSQETLLERLYVTSILHDIATPHDGLKGLAPATFNVSFELNGALIAHNFLLDVRADHALIGETFEAIAEHTTEYKLGNWSTTAWSGTMGSIIDLTGPALGFLDFVVHNRTIHEINTAYPRDGLREDAIAALHAEVLQKPGSLATGNIGKLFQGDPNPWDAQYSTKER